MPSAIVIRARVIACLCASFALMACRGGATTHQSPGVAASTSAAPSTTELGADTDVAASAAPMGSAVVTAVPEQPADSGQAPPVPKPTTRKIPPAILSLDGPQPRDADASREAVVDALRPKIIACYTKHGGSPSGPAGRMRAVVHVGKAGKITRADVTPSGSLSRAATRCARDALAASSVPLAPDTPSVVSFVVVLPPR